MTSTTIRLTKENVCCKWTVQSYLRSCYLAPGTCATGTYLGCGRCIQDVYAYQSHPRVNEITEFLDRVYDASSDVRCYIHVRRSSIVIYMVETRKYFWILVRHSQREGIVRFYVVLVFQKFIKSCEHIHLTNITER